MIRTILGSICSTVYKYILTLQHPERFLSLDHKLFGLIGTAQCQYVIDV